MSEKTERMEFGRIDDDEKVQHITAYVSPAEKLIIEILFEQLRILNQIRVSLTDLSDYEQGITTLTPTTRGELRHV